MSKGLRYCYSIDEYIDRQKNDDVTTLGKLAILYTILKKEAQSHVAVSSSNIYNTLDAGALSDTWYVEFARAIFRPVDRASRDHLFRNLAIIDFNYDRCLDQFLRYAIRDGYTLGAPDADALLDTLVHHRPYGSLGNLQTEAQPNGLAFGKDPKSVDIYGVIGRLKTYTERIASEEIHRIKEEFANSHRIVFLGFGFNQQNMELIAPARASHVKQVIATAKGVSEDDRRIIKEKIAELCGNGIDENRDVIVRDLTCYELFKEYRLTLQAA